MFTFNKTKYALIFLNTVYSLAGAGLLYICAGVKFSDPPLDFMSVERVFIVGEIFSMVLAVIGMYAVFRHHQVIMFFYIIILSILLIVEGELSFEILKSSNENRAKKVWDQMKTSDQIKFMETHQCFPDGGRMNSTDIPTSIRLPCLSEDANCQSCDKKITDAYEWWNNLIGYWSLGCSLTKIPGVVLTRHYRNLKDPRSHSSAFL